MENFSSEKIDKIKNSPFPREKRGESGVGKRRVYQMVYELTLTSVQLKTGIFNPPAKLINNKELTCAAGMAYRKAYACGGGGGKHRRISETLP